MTVLTSRERARLRKQRSREKQDRDTGQHRFEVVLNSQEMAALERGRVSRNPGREPYRRNEYLALLLLADSKRLDIQEKALPPCSKCGSRVPEHCGGAFRGEHDCWLTIDCLTLNLGVTGHGDNDSEV